MPVVITITKQVALRWLIGVVLLWAALGKLANVQEFYTVLLAYRLPLPPALLRATAAVLPWMEMLCGLLLIGNIRTKAALAWAVVLFAAFAVATGQAWMRGLDVDCGCLDLRMLGMERGSAWSGFIESAGFACIRAALLMVLAGWLAAGRDDSRRGDSQNSE